MKTEEVANLPITNDFMFARIMSDQTICKALLETILHLHIREIHYLETQKTMNINVDTHGIRLDIYVEDDKQVYNVECQTTNNRNLATRCRYYQSNIDMDLLKKGDDYYTLKKSFIIFICTFDPFKLGFYQYTFKNFCQEDKTLPLDDGTAKIFLNTEGKTGAIGEDLIQ
ncbi:MAG: Rpn family recombination-promoting nuclease/putative transposase, partial [Eubacterium sp.]